MEDTGRDFKCPFLAANPRPWLGHKCIHYKNPHMKATLLRHHICDHHRKTNDELGADDPRRVDPAFFEELAKLSDNLKGYDDEQLWQYIYKRVLDFKHQREEANGVQRPAGEAIDVQPYYSLVWLKEILNAYELSPDSMAEFENSPMSQTFEYVGLAPAYGDPNILNNNLRMAFEVFQDSMNRQLLEFLAMLQGPLFYTAGNASNHDASLLQNHDMATMTMQNVVAAHHTQSQQLPHINTHNVYGMLPKQYSNDHPQCNLQVSPYTMQEIYLAQQVSPIDLSSAETVVDPDFGFYTQHSR